MTIPTEALFPALSARDRIIIALDVETAAEGSDIVRELHTSVGAFKIGLQLFTAAGPQFVRELTNAGHKVFLDLKFHDIPNTVASASVEAARLGVWMFNIHAAGGSHMMTLAIKKVDEVCEREKIDRPLIVGVTVLTSSNLDTLAEAGVGGDIETQVVALARLSADSGLDGVVASPREVVAVRNAVRKSGFLTITPGIRPNRATDDDQKRVTTFREALDYGSDYVVIGRPIMQAKDRRAGVEQIVAEIEGT